MKNITLILLLFAASLAAAAKPLDVFIKQVTDGDNKTWYVFLVSASDTQATHMQIWFREKQDASSVGDKVVADISAKKATFQEFLQSTCKKYRYIDDAQTIVGCLATVGGVFCAVSAPLSGGTTAFVCSSVWDYAAITGAKDCLKGVSTLIAEQLGRQKEWTALMSWHQLKEPSLTEAVRSAIDFMCDNLDQNPR